MLLISLLCSTPMVWANPQLESEYALKGGALYILPHRQFAVIAYATALAGNYEIQVNTLQFHWTREKYLKFIIQEFSDLSEVDYQDRMQPKLKQLIIHFDSNLPDTFYLGGNQPLTSPQLKRVFNEDSNCYEYSKMNQNELAQKNSKRRLGFLS